jgi:hypothetical protein
LPTSQGAKTSFSTKDLTAQSPAITAITVELVVADFTQYTDDEIIPIDEGMKAQVINMVVQQFLPEQPRPQIIDPTSDTK